MQQWIDKAEHLIEALPYIRRFNGKTFVIKCGGAAMIEPAQMQNIMQDIALLHFCGIRTIVIHGGGPEISSLCDRLKIPTQFANGLRVTDAATMEIVQMVLLGKINRGLVTELNQHGVKAVGVSGQDSAFLQVEKLITENTDLGFVGHITSTDTTLLNTLLTANFAPVIAPIGVDKNGQAYNINADIAAAAIASALSAEKLIVLSDVNGVYADPKNPDTRMSTVTCAKIKLGLAEGTISGGMIPKLQACLEALDHGVASAHILDGKMPHSLLLEIFTDKGIGTKII